MNSQKRVKVEFVKGNWKVGDATIIASTKTEFKRNLREARKLMNISRDTVTTSDDWKGFEN